MGKFLYDVVEFGFRLCDLGVSEGRLYMKEPQVGVLCPEIWELDGDFDDKLSWSFFPVGHEGFRIIVYVEITRVDDYQYYAPYPFYLVLLNLVELV